MLALAKVLFHLAIGLWVGAVVFVSFVAAPAVFHALPSETAGMVMGRIFPLYYGCTVAAGIIALAAAIRLRRKAGGSAAWTAVVVMVVVMLAATTYAGAVVNPRARALRPVLHSEPVDPKLHTEFDTLHRRAVQLNSLVLILGLTTIAISALNTRLPGE